MPSTGKLLCPRIVSVSASLWLSSPTVSHYYYLNFSFNEIKTSTPKASNQRVHKTHAKACCRLDILSTQDRNRQAEGLEKLCDGVCQAGGQNGPAKSLSAL